MTRPSVGEREAEQLLLDAIRRGDGKLTRSDAIAQSGLPKEQTEKALTVLLRDYRSHLSATESGELVYEFDRKPVRRTAVTFRERLTRVGRALWRGFKVAYKIAIAATLVIYFVVFLAMLLALIFAKSSGNSDDRDDSHHGGGFDPWILFWFWGWGPSTDPYGRPQQRRRRGKSFYRSVFDFVFGPERPAAAPLEEEREILSYIRSHRGRITATDLVRLFGWDLERAEEEATRLMAQYGGEPEVTEDGVVVYVFRDLRVTAAAAAEGIRARDAWERIEKATPLTGNTPGMNAAVTALNGFNLLAPFWIVPAVEAAQGLDLERWGFLLRDFPLTFSALFFAIPLGRALVERSRRKASNRRNALRRVLQRVFGRRGEPAAPELLAQDPLERAELDRNLVALGGDVEADDDGHIRYGFPRLREETAAVERVRREAPEAERSPGEIIWSSKD